MHSNDDFAGRHAITATRRATLLTAAVGLGASAVGSATAQDAEETTARIYASDYFPDAQFRVVSGPLDYEPAVRVQKGESFLADLYWSEYETRIPRYGNTRERVLLFPPADAAIEQGRAYRTGQIRSTEELANGVVTIGYRPVAEAGDGTDERQ